MSDILSFTSDDSNDSEDCNLFLNVKAKKRLSIILSDDDDVACSSTGEGLGKPSDMVIKTITKQKFKEEAVVKKSYVIGSPSKKCNKSQRSILAYSQQTLKVSKASNCGKQPMPSTKQGDLKTECPICFQEIAKDKIEAHADSCADFTPLSTLESISSQEILSSPKKVNNNELFDSTIFDNGVDHNVKSSPEYGVSGKRPTWNLHNSFDSTEDHNPSKRMKKEVPLRKSNDNVIAFAPYPEMKESRMRGCLRYSGNNPGNSMQSTLKKMSVHTPSTASFENSFNQTGQSASKSSGFKMHPFLAKAQSSSANSEFGGSKSMAEAVLPDGEGGFIINDDALGSDDEEEVSDFSLPSITTNGFIDFNNQFKEKSTARPKKKAKPKKSPKKKPWKAWRGRGKRGRGRGRTS